MGLAINLENIMSLVSKILAEEQLPWSLIELFRVHMHAGLIGLGDNTLK